jgi:hypothetical protein
MIKMKTLFTALTAAALLAIASGLPGYAEDATASKTTPTPTTTQTGPPDILSVQFPTPAPLTGCGLSSMSLIFVASTTWVRGF